jgi:hypothetical protein
MKKYIVILLEREDWDSPQIEQVEAKDGDEAFSKFAKLRGFSSEELEEGEAEGEISIIVKQII